jgi:hypothetical protein
MTRPLATLVMFTRDDKGQYNGILTGFDDDLDTGIAQARTAALKETIAYLATLTDEERSAFFSEWSGMRANAIAQWS